MAEKIKGLTVKLGFDNSEFKKKMKESDKDIKSTENQVKALQKSLELKWDSAKFAEAQKIAQNAITKTDEKVKELRTEMGKLSEKGIAPDSSTFINLQTEITKTEDKAEKLRMQIQQLNEMKVDRIADSIKSMGDTITKAGQALAPLSAAATALIAGFGALGLSAVKAGDEIGTTAQQLNISTDALQRWRYIAQQTDVDQAQLTNGLRKIQQALGNLAAGQIDTTSDALRGLGFTSEQAAKGMGENFEDIINALANMEDATMQAYYANELFGARMGSQIIPMLNDGGDGLARLSKEFETFGYLTKDQVDALDAFEDVLDKIKYSFKTIKDQIGVALLPLMQEMADVVQNKIVPAIQKAADFFASLTIEQQKWIFGIITAVAALAPALLIVGKLTTGVGSLIGVVMKLHGALGALSGIPIVLIIGAVIALLAILYTSNEKFRESINKLIGVLGSALTPVLDIVMSLLNVLIQTLMPIINILGDVLAPIITMFVTFLEPLIQLMVIRLIPMLKSMEFMFKIIQISMLPLMVLFNLLGKALTWFSGIMGDVFDWVIDKMNIVLHVIEFMINKAIDLINGLIRGINNLGGWLGISLGELDKVKMQIETSSTINTKQTITATPSSQNNQVKEAIGGVPGTISNSTVNYSNDNSTKNVTIEVTVQNYAAEVDVDKMVQDIQIKLAEAY